MRLEGTLDAFSLPDVFTLLSMTKKTGTLHVRRNGVHGAIHLREGALTGARSDVRRQALARRLVGAGLVDDEALASAVEGLLDTPTAGLGRVLAAALDPDAAHVLAREQVTDAVFDLLRWPDGDFAFVLEHEDPDDLGVVLSVDDVVGEGRRRLEAWRTLTSAVPDPDALVCFAPAPAEPPVLSTDEWQLLQHVDGRRTVADLVQLSGRGDYALVEMLSAMVERGLLVIRTTTDGDALSGVLRRQNLLAALEGMPLPADPAESTALPAVGPAPLAEPDDGLAPAVFPERPEPFLPARRPDHPEPSYAHASASGGSHGAGYVGTGSVGSGSVGAVHGSAALQPDPAAIPVERDPSVNRSLLLRLIAGVRGL